ncbi:hypothetical protein FS749_009571, partial [Ceratobasidium sp. UAMH 11750]
YSPEKFEDPGPDPHQPSRMERGSTPSALNRHAYRRASAEWQTVSYRPTDEGCLMRQVAKPDFCVVCTEALWLKLLARVSLIDAVAISSNCPSEEDEAHITSTLASSPSHIFALRLGPHTFRARVSMKSIMFGGSAAARKSKRGTI